jgi:pimeloyl-ACP methyl ester carboxylesterase
VRNLVLPFFLFAAGMPAQSITGDWAGSLPAGGGVLRLLFHFSQSADGSLAATFDSLDQNARGMAISSIKLAGSKLTLSSQQVNGAFDGSLSPDGGTIEGSWTQRETTPLTLHRVVRSEIAGDWSGILDAGQKLRLVFHLTGTTAGIQATLDSLDQGAKGIPVSSATLEGRTLTMALAAVGGAFRGTLSADGSTLEGSWTQGQSFPLVLKRGSFAAPPPRRPQNPVKPYPYVEEEVVYQNPSGGFNLAATLTLPRGKGPFPAVLLITGSGPQDRDEALMGHRPFLVLADFLTRKGIAVIRADDRGVGKSGGRFDSATTADFATDAEAGITYLKSRPEVDRGQIGLIGHSEGGVIAPMVAARNHDVAFIVMMAGSGVPGDQLLPEQAAQLAEAAGVPHAAARFAAEQERRILALVDEEKDPTVLRQKVRAVAGANLADEALGAQIAALRAPWMRYFLSYDPATALHKVTCRVLVLNGSLDRQVPPGQNLPAIRAALEKAGNKHFEILELPGLNHLFQTAKTGSVAEYEQIEETIAPAVLEKIAGWILKR